MSYNIEVQSGSTVRLPTKGKYCDRDIVVTATAGEAEDTYGIIKAGTYIPGETFEPINLSMDIHFACNGVEYNKLECWASARLSDVSYYGDNGSLYAGDSGNFIDRSPIVILEDFDARSLSNYPAEYDWFMAHYTLQSDIPDYPVYDGEPLDITETELTDKHVVFKADTEPMIVDSEVAVKMNKSELGGVMAEQVPEGYTFTSRYGINQVGKMPVYDYTPYEGHYFQEDGEGNFVFDAPLESFVVLEDEVSIKVPKEDFGNAYPHMVVDGWEFTSAGGVKQKGTMPIYDYTPIEGSFESEDDDNLLFMAPSPQQQVVEDELWISVPREDFGNAKPEDVAEGAIFTSAEGYRQVGTHKCSGGGGDRTAIEDGLISRTLKEYINNTVTSIGNYAFGNFTSLEYVSLPNVTEIVGGNHFASCTNLKAVNIPNLKTSISSSGNNFRQCSSLEELRVPLYNGVLAVSGCTSLKVYEVATPYNIAAGAFSNLAVFDTFIMHCTKVVPLSNVSAFNGTPFASGGTGGKVYVPQQFIEGFKTATNWSVLYEAGTCEFIAIEGSEYE